jgi:hypothetical protein
MKLVIASVTVRDSFTPEFLDAYARMVIAFGRLEHIVKLTIKTFRVSMKLSPDFMHGIAEAERHKNFAAQCENMAKLHRQRFGECDDGFELRRWIEIATKLAIARGKVVHGLLTIDDDGKPLVRHTRLRGESLHFTEMNVSTDGLAALREKVEGLTHWLDGKRREWESA